MPLRLPGPKPCFLMYRDLQAIFPSRFQSRMVSRIWLDRCPTRSQLISTTFITIVTLIKHIRSFSKPCRQWEPLNRSLLAKRAIQPSPIQKPNRINTSEWSRMPQGNRVYPLPPHGSIVILPIKLMYPAGSWVRPNNILDSTEPTGLSNQLEQRLRAFFKEGY